LESMYPDEFVKGENGWHEITILPRIEGEWKLAPLHFRFSFPPTYPAEEPPNFSLVAPWLNRTDGEILRSALLETWKEQQGSPILFTWIEWLRDNVFSCLNWKNEDFARHTAPKGPTTQPLAPDFSKVVRQMQIEIYHGEPVTDRKSKFQAHLAHVETVEEVAFVISDLLSNKKIASATHNISAYRLYKNGILTASRDDDGETGAGDKLLYMLERMKVTNVVVVVTRWFGGVLLGPDRFKLINNVAKELLLKHVLKNNGEDDYDLPIED